jgi:hypothetical protein
MAMTENDTIKSVNWATTTVTHSTTWDDEGKMTATAATITLTGRLTVALALTGAFITFVLSGITFTLSNPGVPGATSFNFTYTGTHSAAFIQSLFVTGANITLNT